MRGNVILRLFPILAGLSALAASGCASQQAELRTPRYTLTYPEEWTVVSKTDEEGKASVIKVGFYGDAEVQFGAQSGLSNNRPADIEVRMYGWPQNPAVSNPTLEMANRLIDDPDLELKALGRVRDQPPECGLLANKKYKVFGVDEEPINMLGKNKWRAILVGGQSGGTYLGVVARVPFETDINRYCASLTRMQVELQHVLDAIKPNASPSAAPAATPVAPGAGSPAGAPSPAPAGEPAGTPPADPGSPGATPPATPPQAAKR